MFILKYKHRYAVKLMCKVLKISESGYYRWLKNKDKPSKRHLLLVTINEIISEHPDNANYGYDRIHKALEIRGIKVSRNTVYRAMKDGNLIHKAMNYSQVSRHKKAHFFRGAGYFVCSQYKASASFGVSILSVPCGLFVL